MNDNYRRAGAHFFRSRQLNAGKTMVEPHRDRK